jgi:hypothetical protein
VSSRLTLNAHVSAKMIKKPANAEPKPIPAFAPLPRECGIVSGGGVEEEEREDAKDVGLEV